MTSSDPRNPGRPPCAGASLRRPAALLAASVLALVLVMLPAASLRAAQTAAAADPATGVSPAAGAKPAEIEALPDGLYARIDTPRGVLVAVLEYGRAPLTAASFVGLAEGRLGPRPGAPFFEGLRFHRVVSGFVIQGGDPLGTGEGGPGYAFPDEFGPGLHHDGPGVLSMANSGPDTNGSQFFITLADTTRLNYLHSVFGRVVLGAEVPALVRQGDAMRVTILRRGAAARAFAADRAAFEALRAGTRAYAGPAEPGPAAAFDDPDGVLPTDAPRARNFNFKLANYERATGLRVRAAAYGRRSGEKLALADAPGREALLAARAAELGIAKDGVLAVYLAESGRWLLWAAEPRLARLAKEGEGRDAALSRVCAEALRRGAELEARAAQAAQAKGPGQAGGRPPPPALRAKYAVDAMLDLLLLALEPAPGESGGRDAIGSPASRGAR